MSTPYDPKMDDLQETSEAVYQSAVREWNYGKPAPNKAQTATQTLRSSGHSPLPWSEKDGIITAGISPGQPYIADCRVGQLENREANSRLIIESVNNYALLKGNRDYYKSHSDKLAEALRRFCNAYQTESDHDLECAEAEASKALAAYESERQ